MLEPIAKIVKASTDADADLDDRDGVYPAKVKECIDRLSHGGPLEQPDGSGTDVSFECGTYASIELKVDREMSAITHARFRTNGCGFAVAACEVLAAYVRTRRLQDLHGADDAELGQILETELGSFPAGREHCARLAAGSLHAALAAYRSTLIDEYRGEQALICTCFGVGEDAIVSCIRDNGLSEVGEVVERCRAGGGCGSCRPLIQELIDAQSWSP